MSVEPRMIKIGELVVEIKVIYCMNVILIIRHGLLVLKSIVDIQRTYNGYRLTGMKYGDF